MTYIEDLVQTKSSILKGQNYNLDISYITSRLLASSFPTSSISSNFNHIDQVSKFMNQRHQDKYLIFNISGISYDSKKFNEQIVDCPWVNKYSPSLGQIFAICHHIDEFLKACNSHVVLVHCVSGKGRTGVIIASYLIYCCRFNDSDDAIKYYNRKRFEQIYSVLEPAYKRYVNYFSKIINDKYDPQVKYIQSIQMENLPQISEKQNFRPVIEIYSTIQDQTVYNDKEFYEQQRKNTMNKQFFNNKIKRNIINPFPVVGDVVVKLLHDGFYLILGKYENSLLGRVAFNTNFIKKNELQFKLQDFDPFSVTQDQKIPKEFKVTIKFSNYYTPEQDELKYSLGLYQLIVRNLIKQPEIMTIQTVLQNHKQNDIDESTKLLFFDSTFDDILQVIVDKKFKRSHHLLSDNFIQDDDVDN